MSPTAGIGLSLGQASTVHLSRAATVPVGQMGVITTIGIVHSKSQHISINNHNLTNQEEQVMMICGNSSQRRYLKFSGKKGPVDALLMWIAMLRRQAN